MRENRVGTDTSGRQQQREVGALTVGGGWILEIVQVLADAVLGQQFGFGAHLGFVERPGGVVGTAEDTRIVDLGGDLLELFYPRPAFGRGVRARRTVRVDRSLWQIQGGAPLPGRTAAETVRVVADRGDAVAQEVVTAVHGEGVHVRLGEQRAVSHVQLLDPPVGGAAVGQSAEHRLPQVAVRRDEARQHQLAR